MPDWHFITGHYPPQPGGVSDYTEQLARALARRGESVHVWASGGAGLPPEAEPERGLRVHRLERGFGLRGLAQLSAGLAASREPPTLLVQYVPHAFGYRAMNLAFAAWVAARRRERVWVMFHEAVFPFGERPLRTNVIAAATHVMAALLVNRAERVLVSTPVWERHLAVLKRGPLAARWLPIPSNLPVEVDRAAARELRARLLGDPRGVLLGHFGTYGAHIAPLVEALVPRLLERAPERRLLLLGRGGDGARDRILRRHPSLRERVLATGALAAPEIALHLASCDLLVQPYPDGLTTRRTSLMAGLALGVPVVSNRGALTEPEWAEWGGVGIAEAASGEAVAHEAERWLSAPAELAVLAQRGAASYRARFSVDSSTEALLALRAADVPTRLRRPAAGEPDLAVQRGAEPGHG